MLTDEKINAVLKELQGNEATVLRLYWDRIPVGDYTETEKLEYIIAGTPGSGDAYAGMLAYSLQKPVPWWGRYDNAPSNKPELIHNWVSKYPEHAHYVAEFMCGRKAVPDRLKANEEWLCLVAVDELVDWANSIYQWPQRGEITLERFDELIIDFVKGFG